MEEPSKAIIPTLPLSLSLMMKKRLSHSEHQKLQKRFLRQLKNSHSTDLWLTVWWYKILTKDTSRTTYLTPNNHSKCIRRKSLTFILGKLLHSLLEMVVSSLYLRGIWRMAIWECKPQDQEVIFIHQRNEIVTRERLKQEWRIFKNTKWGTQLPPTSHWKSCPPSWNIFGNPSHYVNFYSEPEGNIFTTILLQHREEGI